jgi:hypothetical protein
MKSLILIITLLRSKYVFAQDQPSGKLFPAEIPKNGWKKVSMSDSAELSQKGYQMIRLPNNKNSLYEKNGLLMFYTRSNDIHQLRRSLEQKSRTGNPEISSEIINVNGIKYFVVKSQIEDSFYAGFTSDYDSEYNYVHGTIEYKTADEAKANVTLQELIKNIRYQ